METTVDTYAGGLISYASHVTTVECTNCYTDVTIIADNAIMVGGVVGRSGAIYFNNCYNIGNITATKANAGGIIGYTTGITNIDNCYNHGIVRGASSGGIVGCSYYNKPLNILNSYNNGKITGTNAGGIVGNQSGINSSIEIKNSYNIGDITGTNVGGILNSYNAMPTIENCYNAGNLDGNNIEAGIIGNAKVEGKIINCFFLNTTEVSCSYSMEINDSKSMSKNEMQNQNFVDQLNSYIEVNSKEWKKWKLEENGYPVFT